MFPTLESSLPSFRRVSHVWALSMGLLAGPVLAANFQRSDPIEPPQEPKNSAKTADPLDQRLDTAPFEVEGLGLKINLPVGANIVAERIDQQLVVTVNDDPTTPTWTLRIQALQSTAEKPSASGQIQSLLDDLKASKQEYRVISNSQFMAGSLAGQLCYVQQIVNADQPIIAGWLLVPTGERTFMVFFVQTLPEHLVRVRPLLEASFATISLKSVEEITAGKRVRLEAGQSFLNSLTPERLKALVGQTQWHRIYKPDDPQTGVGPQEIGYSRVEVLEAKRGAINENNDESKYAAGEQELGLLVRVQARLVGDVQRKDYYDSIANFWMRWDQSEEVWSIRATRRQGDAERSESEVGVREAQSAGSPQPRLTIVKRTDQTDPVSYEWPVPDVYLSQTLGWLIGRMLPREGAKQQVFSYYYFVSSSLTPKVYQRIDTWTPAADGTGQWILYTQLTSDTPPYTAVYGPDGHLVRRMHADGTITEPIALPELQRIWKSKGMQIGDTNR